jgi:hypothetical protein
MQLTNASVASFEDGVLTLAFAQAGTAKGFLVAENDKVLAGVLADMFGIKARIATSVGTGDAQGAAGPSGAHSPPEHERPVASQSGARGEQRPAGSAAGGQGSESAGSRRPQRPARQAGPGVGSEPGHDDHQDADALTGTDLVARELGGRIIEELGEP